MASLSPALVSLVHHVQLNQQGWWDRATERLVLAAIYDGPDSGVAAQDVADQIRKQFKVTAAKKKVEQFVALMSAKGLLVRSPNGLLQVSEAQCQVLDQDRVDGLALESRVRAKFSTAIEAAGFVGGDVWTSFFDEWLRPTISVLGARTYDLLATSTAPLTSLGDFGAFLDKHSPDHQRQLREGIATFLNPSDVDLRSYLLRMMDAVFVIEASQLQESTIEAIGSFAKRTPRFTLLLDTNVIFSVLGLHGPDNKHAITILLELAGELDGKLAVKSYVLPATIEEAIGVLRYEMRALGPAAIPRHFARAAVDTGATGEIATAYYEAVVSSGQPLTPAAFFGPYINNMIEVLRTHGIELYNFDLTLIQTRKDFQDEVADQVKFETRRYGERAKSRDRLLHDTLLWRVVDFRRPSQVEAPSSAEFWVVTEDFRLIAFDLHKLGKTRVPICVRPINVLQMIQLWSGRTERVEEALVGTLKLSMLSPEFDRVSEQVTVSILNTLARFENISDFPEAVISGILVNEALRGKMKGESDFETKVRIIRDELVREYSTVVEERDRAKAESERLAFERDQLAATHAVTLTMSAAAEQNAVTLATEYQAAVRRFALAQTRAEGYERILIDKKLQEDELAGRLTTLERAVANQSADNARLTAEREVSSFAFRWMCVPALALSASAFAATRWVWPPMSASWQTWVPSLVLCFLIWSEIGCFRLAAYPTLNNSRLAKALQVARTSARWMLLASAAGVLGEIAIRAVLK